MDTNMEQKPEMKNSIIVHMEKEGKVISANEITAEAADEMKEFIRKIYVNETGGITIILGVELFSPKPEDDDLDWEQTLI